MGFFDFLKNKKTQQETTQPIDGNVLLLEILKEKLIAQGYQIELSNQYLALTVNSEIEIASVIVDTPNMHQSLIQLMIIAIHPKYFPDGIVDNIAGVGQSLEEKIESALDNYLKTTFSPIIKGFSEQHTPTDFTTNSNGKEVLWHPNLGDLIFQGDWKEFPDGEPIFEMLKEKIKNKLEPQKFNWLKVYTSKNSQGEIIGECFFNNKHWPEGYAMLDDYAKNWNENVDYFLGQKQFMMFRRCDKSDTEN